MKRKLTEEKEKKTSFSTDYTKLTNQTVNRILITRIAQIILTVDMTIIGTGINTITTIILNPMNKSSPRRTSLVSVKLTQDNFMNERVFNILIPQSHTNHIQTSSSKFYNQQPRSSHSVHWVEDQNQQTEYFDKNNYTDAITDFFALNF